MAEKKKKGDGFPIRIGPLMKQIFEKQKEKVKKETYDCIEASDYDVSEILAKKILKNNLI